MSRVPTSGNPHPRQPLRCARRTGRPGRPRRGLVPARAGRGARRAGVADGDRASDRARVRRNARGYLHWRDLSTTGALHPDRARRILAEATGQLEAATAAFTAANAHRSSGDAEAVLAQEAQEDLMSAVRRHSAAVEDLRYLTDPSWMPDPGRQNGSDPSAAADWLARSAAHERVRRAGYRGQLH